jgi:carotenoid cleavage dioxygenase-like enzyme
MKLADEFIAMTETPLAIRFDTRLATKGHHAFNAVLPGTITTAHPHIDYETGVLFNYLTQLGINSSYTIYTIDLATGKQQHVASISAEKPSYMHSFSLTKNYIILTEIPLRVSPIIALFSNEPFIKNFVWEPEVGTWFTIVHRRTGELVGRYRTEPFFMFHQINAFEEGDTIIVDLVVYDDPSIIQSFLVDDALSGLGKQIRFQPTRYSLNMSDRSVTVRHLASVDLEMPRIYYEKYTMQPYSFVYGMSGWNLNDPEHMLMKVNVRDGSVLRWSAPRCFPGEPVFVPTPDGSAEDDGILLCVVLDTKVRSSFLLVLDAKTMQEVGRAQVPHHIPFGLHGNFFKH